MISKIAILIALLTSNLALSQISKEEWVSLCKKATGERKRTCKTIREKFGIKKGIFHENWDTTYDELSRHRDLKLYHRQISDLSPLSGFDHFKVLCLQGNNISDIRPLAGMTNLDALNLNSNLVFDLTPLAELRKLRSLFLENNQISDIAPLANLVNLRVLRIRHNLIEDISALTELSRLDWLYIRSNPVEDMSPVHHVQFVIGKSRRQIIEKNFQLINRLPRAQEIAQDNDTACSICFYAYKEDEEVSEIPACHHMFHRECLEARLKKDQSCPSCRRTVLEEE